MAAPIGNKNAEKWTKEKSKKLLCDIIKAADEQEQYLIGSGVNAMTVEGYKYDFIGEISLAMGAYHELITRDIPRRFPELKELSDYIVRLMERNCYSNVKKGIINTAVGIINLKSNHKWTDRTQTDHNVSVTDINPLHWVSDE